MAKKKNYSLENKIILGAIVMIALIVTIVYFVNRPDWAEWPYGNEKDRNGLLMKDFISMLGGLIVIAGLYISYIRSRAFQESVEKQNVQLENQQTEITLTV